jgi:hypothetical protein
MGVPMDLIFQMGQIWRSKFSKKIIAFLKSPVVLSSMMKEDISGK